MTMTAEQFSRVVLGVYDAAVTTSRWPAVMRTISAALEATSAAIVSADAGHRRLQCTVLPGEALISYGDHYGAIDYVLAEVESGPIGLVCSARELIDSRPGCEFDADWLGQYDIRDGLLVRLRAGPCPASFVVAASRQRSLYATDGRLGLVNALVPHLQNALRTHDAMAECVRQCDELSEVLDAVPGGMVVVDAGSRVVHLNQAAHAVLRRDDGLQIHGGRLRAAHSQTDRCVAHAIALATDATVPRGSVLRCPRTTGDGAYVVHVTPMHRIDDDSSADRALVMVVDPERDRTPPARVLQHVFGLTAAEAAVAILILNGHGVRAVADELNASQATVRTHLQRVFVKTGTHRQSELVHLLASYAP